MLYLFELPKQRDFLLELKANNFSKKTIKNYKRDLSLFALFLEIEGVYYRAIKKKTMTLYKGFLQSGEYLKYLKQLQLFKKSTTKGTFTVKEISDLLLFINGPTKRTIKIDDKQLSLVNKVRSLIDVRKPYRGRYGFLKSPQDGLAARSINRCLSSIRSYLRFCIDFDYLVPISPDAIKLIKTEKKVSQVPEIEDLIKLIECPTQFEGQKILRLRNRAILELLFSTGLRISELVSLDRDQMNKQGKIYVIGKGKKGRFVYLTKRALYHMDCYLLERKDNKNALFIPYRGGRHGTVGERISTNYIQEKLSEYRRRLNIVVPTTPHTIRHGFATYLAEKGASPAAIQILLGHSSLDTTTRYVHASDKFAEKTHRKFHPLYKK